GDCVRSAFGVFYLHLSLANLFDLGEEEEAQAAFLYLSFEGVANPVLDAAAFGVAVLPVRGPDGECGARAAFGEEERGLGCGVAAADDEHVLAHVWKRLDEAVSDFGEVFAGDTEAARAGHRARADEHARGGVMGARRSDAAAFRDAPLDARDLFFRVDAQLHLAGEADTLGQMLFARV